MNRPISRSQRGATLFVGLIMLVLITLMVVTALNMSTSNSKAVGNMQFRDEAIAAANAAIEERLASTFNTAPATTTAVVDIDNDTTGQKARYSVALTPTCVRATLYETPPPSSLSLPILLTQDSSWLTVWDIQAVVTDQNTGASVEVHSGVRVQLNLSQKNLACP